MTGHRTTLTQHGVPIRLGIPAMKLHSFFALTAVSFASLPLRPASALAQGESPASLEYVAPTPDCASSDAFQALVKAEIARFPSSDRNRRLSVRIVQQDGLYAGTLTTETGAVRTITAARCDDVTAALAVIIAVAEPSGAAPADTPSPPADGHAQVDLSQPNEPDRERQGSASGLEWRVGARGFASTHGADPSLGANAGALGVVSLELPWGFDKMMFEVGAGMSTEIGGSPEDVTYLILDTQACLLDLPIGSTGLSVLGCLRLDGAEFRSARVGGPAAFGVAPPTNNGGAFWTGASARLRWQSPVRVFVEGNVDGMVGTVSAGEDNIPAWFAIGLGVGLRI
jgi:hypothetical protein